MKIKQSSRLSIGIAMMILSSMSTCFGQLFWKLAGAGSNLLFYIFGFALYGLGALMMICAFQFGGLSVLHPMLSVGFIASIFVGAAVLGERITLTKVSGILLIIVGMIFLSRSGRKEQR
jgi:undecaprenyl phosphate-alpha-L-ara4N flippase subunit ArnE